MKITKKIFAIVCVFAFTASAAFAQIPLEQWAHNHPAASKELGEWVKNHPKAARIMFEWDGNHPERSQEFVTWTINHPKQEIDAFAAMHPNWSHLDEIMKSHRPAARNFMAWCRKHPKAAHDLMAHKGGLKWAGDHLYKESWNMETPNK
ncbi:MAG: hypothetical protein ABI199_00655 [Bacteroidia bacterium]